MARLHLYSSEELAALTLLREGEKKLGEEFATVSSLEQLATSAARFVLIGLTEDIGVLANGGKPGTANSWREVLPVLCNIQATEKLSGADILLLGCLTFEEELKQAEGADSKKLRTLVSSIDGDVAKLAQVIFAAGKVPIFIGGGHNNAYPILKALSQTQQHSANTINIDAHADFRALEGRHSGNGFSYAFHEGFLSKYAVLGLHENYNSQYLRSELSSHPERIWATFFEDFLIGKTTPERAFESALTFTRGLCGLEIDLDSIAGISASAASPSGFTAEQIRSLIYQTKGTPLAYLHICEGIATQQNLVAKLIGYLVSDFIKAQSN
ncbi:MAG: formimidoylglutamase [Sphingobacteriaceae bacterium]